MRSARRRWRSTPDDRYPSVRALAEEIEHWLADEPVSAWREPRRRRLERWVRRHKPLVAGLALPGDRRPDRARNWHGPARPGEPSRAGAARPGQPAATWPARDLASENFQNAARAVDLFLTNVSEEQLREPARPPATAAEAASIGAGILPELRPAAGGRPNVATAARRGLPAARRDQRRARQSPGGDRRARAGGGDLRAVACGSARGRRTLHAAAARALQSLALFRLRNDEADPGERAVRSAIELLEPLERDHPEIAEYGRRLGRCYDLVGVVGIVSRPEHSVPAVLG